ncbi:MAG: HAMP domain-containing histidine kinase [Tissierellia bacterium]|jgi:K+-sensing histidine kinase KdpD|nr:HAMP domain-containing histidine kinase [Tissierellia bacterium]
MLPYLTNAGTDKPANTLNLAYKNLEEFNYDDDYGEDLKISNELNNIISNIHGESQLIELYALNDKKSGEKPILRKAGSIQQNCLRLIKILNNISDLRKFEKEHLNLCTSNVNIVEIVENLVMNTSNHTKGKIIFDTNVEEKFMTCDINKFQKSLLILLSTALKYSKGDEILVKLKVFTDTIRIDLSFSSKNNRSVDFFKDKMDKPSFDDFDNLSLDLILCKSLADLQKGSISVGGNGKETFFSLVLPCENNDSLHYLYKKDLDDEYLNRQIQIEFSDLLNPYD